MVRGGGWCLVSERDYHSTAAQALQPLYMECRLYLFLLFDGSLEPAHRGSLLSAEGGGGGGGRAGGAEPAPRLSQNRSETTQRCLNSSRSLFSTEGHIFLMQPPAAAEAELSGECRSPFWGASAVVNQTGC